MKNILIITLLFLNISSYGQIPDSIRAILDTVLLKAQQTSLYADSVNWEDIKVKVYQKADDAKTLANLNPAFQTLLNELRDHHGSFMNATNYNKLAYFTDWSNVRSTDERPRNNEILKVINSADAKFEYSLLPDKIGYLKIVGIPANIDVQKEAEKIRNGIIALYKQKADKWIVDLRYNGGGNMNPMIAGLAVLIGNGKIGGSTKANGDVFTSYEVQNGDFYDTGRLVASLGAQPRFKKLPKVAVLTSRYTVSSGELVAVAFKGRNNTQFFGEATGGYTTVTNWIFVNKDLIMSIAESIYFDRNDKKYYENVKPDIELPFEPIKDLSKDRIVIEAVKWLQKK